MKGIPLKTVAFVSLLLVFVLRDTVVHQEAVAWIWSGSVTERSAVVKTRLLRDSRRVRLAVSRTASLSRPRFSQVGSTEESGNQRVLSLPISGLDPDTRYFYAIEVDGRIDRSAQGSFRTFPVGAASFRFVFGSCAKTGSEHPVFLAMRDEDPLFFVNLGDLHYENIAEDDLALFQDAYESVLASPTQSALYRQVPIVYAWDDHDYGANNSNATSPSRRAARLAYQQYVPHYPLVAGNGDVPIYQSFRVGRVYFLLTDGRSERSPRKEPDGETKTIFGEEQKAWLKRELLEAADAFPLVIWLQGSPWIGDGPFGEDPWWSYPTERREIANFIAGHGIRNLLMLAGDAHMLAIDGGRNNRYADDGSRGFPVFHAGPLDRKPSAKGGPYSKGVSVLRGQYGLVEIVDDGGETIRVRLEGKTASGATVLSHSLSLPAEGTRLAGAPGRDARAGRSSGARSPAAGN